MRLWTIQPVEVYEILKQTGKFECDFSKSEFCNDEPFINAYNWLKTKLTNKCGNRNNTPNMIWAWYAYDGGCKKPDLRRTGHAMPGTKSVCLEIDIPDNEVLLSDFDAWHYVLNDMYHDKSQSEAEWDAIHAWFDSLDPETQKKHKLKSWEDIFDITKYSNDWCKNGYYVQAVFWTLTIDQVKKIQYFTAR